ncbi:GDNF family receptor alpha-like [Spea bombifrons]|uniref:GDNF family receptor alpha-like n=1 Tax=Spea bombifrons TaxID=233779 RepID=UPI002349E71F|nr:GDNF family receptor alpha-like [Spea bombifrons]
MKKKMQNWLAETEVVSREGKDCQVKDSLRCNITIHYFIEKYPEFRGCVCAGDIYCSIKKLLRKQCYTKNVQTIPTEPSKSVAILQKSSIQHPRLKVVMPPKENDCILAKQFCKENQHCFSMYENFRRNCANGQCNLLGGGQKCLEALNDLKTTILANCVCLNPTKEKCVKIWNTINNNSCLQHTKERKISRQVDGINEENTDLYFANSDMKSEWESSTLARMEYQSPMTCFNVATLCLGDPVCNRHLAALIKACAIHENVCNVNDCQRTVQLFYNKMPFNVSQMLAFCYCTQSDKNCQHAKEVLHSKPCAVRTDAPMSCLTIIHSCLEDELCRRRYELYVTKCWKHIAKCHNDDECLIAMHPDDLTCSKNDECKAAYIATIGTMLQMECTCPIGLHTNKHHLCHLFFHILHSNSCIENISAKNIHESYIDIQNKKQIKPDSHPFQNDFSASISHTLKITLYYGIAHQTRKQWYLWFILHDNISDGCDSDGGASSPCHSFDFDASIECKQQHI